MTFEAAPELSKSVKPGQTAKFALEMPRNQITSIDPQ